MCDAVLIPYQVTFSSGELLGIIHSSLGDKLVLSKKDVRFWKRTHSGSHFVTSGGGLQAPNNLKFSSVKTKIKTELKKIRHLEVPGTK